MKFLLSLVFIAKCASCFPYDIPLISEEDMKRWRENKCMVLCHDIFSKEELEYPICLAKCVKRYTVH